MINKKKGFSLAELLLCLMIIGVVSAMGITLTKHNVDKANNLYYYTGYINLYNALADILAANPNANMQNLYSSPQIMLMLNERLGTTPREEYNALLNADLRAPVITSNGIKYIREGMGLNTRIEMQVPQRKTRSNPNGVGIVEFLFIEDDGGYLVPAREPLQFGQIVTDQTPNLQQRTDLLPTYIDNGTVGRVIGNNFTQIQLQAYLISFCRLRGSDQYSINGETYLICPPGFNAPPSGVLKVANPRKL